MIDLQPDLVFASSALQALCSITQHHSIISTHPFMLTVAGVLEEIQQQTIWIWSQSQS